LSHPGEEENFVGGRGGKREAGMVSGHVPLRVNSLSGRAVLEEAGGKKRPYGQGGGLKNAGKKPTAPVL